MDPHSVNVTMLGNFTIACGGVTLDAKSGRAFKLWLLLAYLIYNRRRVVSREELLDLPGGREKNDDSTGALLCDFDTFRLFYRMEARSADRRGDAVHVAILPLEAAVA